MSDRKTRSPAQSGPPTSPLVMCDRLLALARDADRAGYSVTAEHLLHLAIGVLDEPHAET